MFKSKAGTENDFLILLGDIFDLSIASYEEAYRHARAFLLLVQKDKIAKNIIYVPGNHDFDMWHTVQHQVRVIYPVRQGLPPRDFRWTQPGLIDDRTNHSSLDNNIKRGFYMPDVFDKPIDPDKPPKFKEELYLNGITLGKKNISKKTNFYVVYPSLYLVTDNGTFIITHGHYLDAFWSIGAEWIPRIVRTDIGTHGKMEDLVALNMPLCQLACSGIGQAGVLSPLIQDIQRKMKRHDTAKVEEYIDRLDDEIDKELEGNIFFEAGTDFVSNTIKSKLKKAIKSQVQSRFREDIMKDPKVQKRFINFYRASADEIDNLNLRYSFAIPAPEAFLFGHTHRPIGLSDTTKPYIDIDDNRVQFLNTGGWIWKENIGGEKQFIGADIFKYDTATGLQSIRIK
jgi:UDP-2,3-diacylglucosamine pyrophosphatase LpxH